MMTPHPQRCETCKKIECWMHPIHEEEIMVKGTALVDPQEFCAVHQHTLQRGCASHSSQQSEGDKVLDELDKKIEQYIKNKPKILTCMVITFSMVQSWMEELRSKGGEQE